MFSKVMKRGLVSMVLNVPKSASSARDTLLRVTEKKKCAERRREKKQEGSWTSDRGLHLSPTFHPALLPRASFET